MRSFRIVFTALFVCAAALLTGCQTAEFALNYQPGEVDTFKVSQETTKEVSFEQPSKEKSKLDRNVGRVEMVFDQKVDSLKPDGTAILDITVKELVFFSKNSKGVNVDFNSKEDESGTLASIIGESYKISMAADGTVEVVDKEDIMKKCRTREAKTIFKDDYIIKRHTIRGIPKPGTTVAKGKSWDRYSASPKGALDSKAFRKTYEVEKMQDGIAHIEMTGSQTNKEIEGLDVGSGSMGFMANIFDTKDTFTGSMVYNTETGEVVKSSESLVSEHVAMEQPKGGDTKKGPDVLTMRFIHKYSFEKI
ncbi:hypothetical protein [Sedimentisphaera salicampi]|uniref:Lipoprotein n=1 Tax=Sedimentisphaera salicampi TaxID=1941349 RepID=A0A1W6LKS6_9BACT|nr:hypothetical protein [Sedimentisphaera salicampi]ARN56369.1 hypothetical protein STSP1_00750 [Sedimentisphaera salicampi]